MQFSMNFIFHFRALKFSQVKKKRVKEYCTLKICIISIFNSRKNYEINSIIFFFYVKVPRRWKKNSKIKGKKKSFQTITNRKHCTVTN